MTAATLPNYRTIEYSLDVESGKYLKKTNKLPFQRLPQILSIEATQSTAIKRNAALVMNGNVPHRTNPFQSGLQSLGYKEWYLANDFEYRNGSKCNSLILAHFANDDKKLTLYYFTGYYKPSQNLRETFASEFIKLTEH